MDTKTKKQKQLDALYAPYKKCMECPLATQGRTTIVFGEGNPDASLFFIGEAPGAQEDITGKPFQGKSGKLLNQILERVGLARSDIFITNMVKCRPPNNRNPTPLESATCKDLLLIKQINIVNPSIICTFGSIALQGLLGKKIKITHVRGIAIAYNTIFIIPTYHPAYVLRNPSLNDTFISDIRLATAMAQQTK